MKQERQETREDHKLPEHIARICIVGKARSGKDTACEILEQEFGFPYFEGRTTIEEYAQEGGIELVKRQDFQKAAQDIIRLYGGRHYSKLALRHFGNMYHSSETKFTGVVYAGSRIIDPVEHFLETPNNLLITLEASEALRYARSMQENKPEDQVSFKEFVEVDYQEMQDILEYTKRYQGNKITITNEGTIDDFRTNLIQAVSNTLGIQPNGTQPTTLSF